MQKDDKQLLDAFCEAATQSGNWPEIKAWMTARLAGSRTPLPASAKPKHPINTGWTRLVSRANLFGTVAALFLFLVVLGGTIGYFYATSRSSKSSTDSSKTVISTINYLNLQTCEIILGGVKKTLRRVFIINCT